MTRPPVSAPMVLAMAASIAASITPFLVTTPATSAPREASCPSLLDHRFKTIQGETRDLCDYKGRVLLVVNTATLCAHTPQYLGLRKLHDKYAGRGLTILGFPSNDFGAQEPGTDKQIADYCAREYSVAFPMFSKGRVAAGAPNPLYRLLARQTGEAPRWNFHKYLIDRRGQRAYSFSSNTDPLDPRFIGLIEKLLKEGGLKQT